MKTGVIDINKNFNCELEHIPSDSEELELINTFTHRQLTAQELFTFSVVLCDNEVDRDCERFSIAALNSLAELFIGKTGIFDHSMSSRDQTSRIYSTEVITDKSRTTSVGEPYTFVKARAYMLRNDKNAALIEEIEAGIKKETSVGCAVSQKTCSVCGKSIMKEPCSHLKGRLYSGKLCHTVLSAPTDAYEWSFVAVPAQRAAGVTKAFASEGSCEYDGEQLVKAFEACESITLSKAQLEAVNGYIAKLSELAEYGKRYREELLTQVIRSGALSFPEMKGEKLSDICKSLCIDQLLALRGAFKAHSRKNDLCPAQLVAQADGGTASNDEFRI